MGQNIYLSNINLEKAINTYFEKLSEFRLNSEKIKTHEANGRITAAPVFAKISSPFYNSSAVDGIATTAKKTFTATDRNPVRLKEGIDYLVVDTGDPVPDEFDTVIMVEDLIKAGENEIEIIKPSIPWQNIRQMGEDIVEGQLILPQSHRIRPVDIGALIAGGVFEIEVYKKPRVAIIPTGTEIVEPGTELKVGDIIEFNSRVFAAQVEEYGGIPVRFDIVKDDFERLLEVVDRASKEFDLILLNAGSSAGREDYSKKVIETLGQVFIHGVAIKPGKPVILGKIADKPIVGIPGFPVSAFFIMENIVKKLIGFIQGYEIMGKKYIDAMLSKRTMSSSKYLEFVRVKLGYIDGKYIAAPIERGAGATMSLVRADGVMEIPEELEGYEKGSVVKVNLLKSEDEIKNTVLCIGSHDLILDIAADLLAKKGKYNLSSAHVGSMGGILSLKDRETHFTTLHLLDTETGEYNKSYIKRYVPGRRIALIKFVKRIQGLMVRKGNPLGITRLEDIVNNNAKFVNRQKGSGTRILLDYELKKLGISPKDINGYEREDYTHISVAAQVAKGNADVGLGVFSAANIMGLDFIPIANEEYDIALPLEYLEHDGIKKFLEVINSDEFKRELDYLGGYDYSDLGNIIIE
ncbi:Molybdopterin molybdenumtransferase [Caloramator mitchellensis]|uniref:Molybdopterin molybdenumtransferase n=1 Tax=Caloramator mitchellensis TaxID=908809 RepID=A0A0R3JZ52_CALMK|nr:molybdopterin biosynthesis protein [Caloramator mitchellensis]KRQ86420.1 Molybdopterin molybdenumtransferase [Caloramator mitchellensis]